MLIDPRAGDSEDDLSSTKKRSLLAIAGTLLAEINLLKLIVAWLVMVALPGLILGFAPLVASAWFWRLSYRFEHIAGIGSLFVLASVVLVGSLGIRPLLRLTEKNFWSLISVVVQPGYILCREGIRHLAERWVPKEAPQAVRAQVRAFGAAGAGLLIGAIAALVVALLWPATRWSGEVVDLLFPQRLLVPALANAVVLMTAYLGLASLAWGLADALMDQPLSLEGFDSAPAGARTWRVAHLSDIHVVGERYGFRIESGRAGPRGNDRLEMVLRRLAELHAENPLDVLLITGDMTDAGRSSEWAEFLDMLANFPTLAGIALILPGNHDLNIVDRANPARLEFPGSPSKRLRQMRMLSALTAVQGDRARVFDRSSGRLGKTLAQAMEPHRSAIEEFARDGTRRLSLRLGAIWADAFPLVVAPESGDDLGVIILNSNAETNFSFTNALGMMAAEDMIALRKVIGQFPRARWIVALHHHLVEYPTPAKVFSERIGTALINGSWFVRGLRPFAGRIITMHGHRHMDWIGACGPLRIVSAPSPVMEATDSEPTCFYIHTLAAGAGDGLALLPPERITITPPPIPATPAG